MQQPYFWETDCMQSSRKERENDDNEEEGESVCVWV